jgi:lipopolysaccharide export LptBFGC system permease protein LptF
VYKSNNDNEEISFADAYKSEILNRDDDEDITSKNLIIILALIAIILGLSIFGYIYISQTNIQSTNKAEDSVIEEEIVEPPKSHMLNNIDELLLEDEEGDEVNDINKDKQKLEEITKKEETYLEQLADLSHEVDGKKR